MNVSRPFIAGIGGGTGSGKTTLARAVRDLLGPGMVTVIETDSYYRDLSHIPEPERHHVNFDHPEALDVDLMADHLQKLRLGRTVQVPAYDFTTHCRTDAMITIEPRPIVIVEGIFALAVPQIRNQLDVTVYIDEHPDVRLKRRIERDIRERGRTAEMSFRQYTQHVLPMHAQYVEPSRHNADMILKSSSETDRLLEVLRAALPERDVTDPATTA